MIAATLEVERGCENLFRRGQSDGYKDFPDYGQHLPINYMKAFICGLPFLWAEKKYWYMPARDLPWDLIFPFVNEYNKKRLEILRVIYLVLDESMSGWRPKTSKTGGLPNISYEPRKPVPLGTMLRNAVECVTGIFVHHDISQSPTDQWKKKWLSPPVASSLPKTEHISHHTAEVLRQAEESEVEKGGWVGGDAWFGSIESGVELMKRLGLFSTFIVKQNLKYFPMEVSRVLANDQFPPRH